MPSWIQHPKTGKLIPKEQYTPDAVDAPFVQGDIEGFVSPIDKSVISDRGQLRRHMAEHGVTDSRDYSENFMRERRNARVAAYQGRSREDKMDRIQRLKSELDKRGL